LSGRYLKYGVCWRLDASYNLLAEGAGFEPANLSVNGFQDRRLRPLGHPSIILFSFKYISSRFWR
jgi:hypothetical protein